MLSGIWWKCQKEVAMNTRKIHHGGPFPAVYVINRHSGPFPCVEISNLNRCANPRAIRRRNVGIGVASFVGQSLCLSYILPQLSRLIIQSPDSVPASVINSLRSARKGQAAVFIWLVASIIV
jgi:hypothetical protein